MKNERINCIVLGNSTAAVSAIESIRSIDQNAQIVLLSREHRHTYARPLISHLLAGKCESEQMYFRPDDFYKKNDIHARFGVSAVEIITSDRAVVTDNAGTLHFEKLLIATGGTPVIPPINGTCHKGVFTFTTWDDVDAIDIFIKKHDKEKKLPRAVVIGAGLIGLKATEALRARGLEVSLIEKEDRLLPLFLDRSGSKLMEQAVLKAGINIQRGITVTRIIGDSSGHVTGVILKNGITAPCEIVILAAGVTPSIAFVQNTPINTDKGILIDDHCMTSVTGIYAAGDVAQASDSLTGVSRPIPIFRNAARQGCVSGINIAGGDATAADTCVMNSVEIFGMPAISVGLSTATGNNFEALEKLDSTARTYRRIVLQNNRIAGALFVGDIDRAGIITGLMLGKVDVSSVRDSLLTDEFGLLSLPLEYRKHIVRGEGIEV